MRTLLFVSFISLLINSVQSSILSRFQEWASNHSIDLSDALIKTHIYSNWVENDKYIIEMNSMNLTFTLAHNAYSGYSSEEFSEIMGFDSVAINKVDSEATEYDSETINDATARNLRGLPLDLVISTPLPSSIDWRSKDVVNPIQDQGQCGSCWAFSTIQAVESATAIKYGSLPKLSEQELVDCDTFANGGRDHGCNGGQMDNAFTWIGKNGGVCSESAYPYTSGLSKTSGSCTEKSCSSVAHTYVASHVDIQINSDNAMMTALMKQPVSVAIEADQKAFQLYSTGVFTAECGTNLDHGVGLVGYGTLNDVDYYILRNSWGISWGDKGYMYLARGNDPTTGKPYNGGAGQCGVLGQGSYPIV